MLVNSSAAVISKARSKYGKRLMPNDYKALVKCSSVASVVSYLKTHTSYTDVLSKINENEVHRGQLEMILRKKLFYEFDSLCRYEMSTGSPFSLFIVRRYEIEQLVHFMLLISCGKTEEYIFSLPSYFTKHTDINLLKLSACKDFDSFLSALDGCVYKKILKDFAGAADGTIDIAGAERALNTFAQQELFNAVSKRKSKKEKQSIKELFDYIDDFGNITRIIRFKKYYTISGENIKEYLMPFGSLRKATIDKLCNTYDIDDLYNELAQTSVGKRIKNMSIQDEGMISIEGRYNMCRKNLYFSSNPAIVMLSYMYVTETELSNIIKIIEGIRYNSTQEHISSLLIYAE